MLCIRCGSHLRGKGPYVVGTRDSFGVLKSFYDPQTNQTIDNWKKWEKAGFRNIGDVKDPRNPEVHEKAKWHAKRKNTTKTPYLDRAMAI